MATSFKQDLLNGVHAFSASYRAQDTFNAALYTTNQGLGAGTTAYSATGEVSGTGYTAGGVAVTFGTPPANANGVAYVTPSANIVFNNVTLSTAFDAVLIYNNTAAGKNAVSVHTFGAQTITAGTLTLTMPSNDSNNALLRLA
jgi:hypothetical protein